MNLEGIEIIKKNGVRFVQMPEAKLKALLEELEDAEDLRDIRAAKKQRSRGEESFPASLALALAKANTNGKRIALFRDWRGLSKVALGEAVGVSGQHVGMIESGKRKGDLALIKKIAKALGIELNDIVG